MRYARLYADPAGETHFTDVDAELRELVDFPPPAGPLLVSAPAPATAWVLLRAPSGWDSDWHPAPRRQLVVPVAGKIEVEVSDGERRQFGSGDLCLLEDTSGRGHRTRILGEQGAAFVMVRLPE